MSSSICDAWEVPYLEPKVELELPEVIGACGTVSCDPCSSDTPHGFLRRSAGAHDGPNLSFLESSPQIPNTVFKNPRPWEHQCLE